MINPNELRIGNWVFRQWRKLTPQRDGFRTDPFCIEKVNVQNAKDYDPVPLDYHLLIKIGFQSSGFDQRLPVLEGYVSIFALGGRMPLTLEIAGNRMPLHNCKSVHQLQNLFFALTGNELKVTL